MNLIWKSVFCLCFNWNVSFLQCALEKKRHSCWCAGMCNKSSQRALGLKRHPLVHNTSLGEGEGAKAGGGRMHVLIKGSLNHLPCCRNETPATNEHRLDCFLDMKGAKTSLWSRSLHGVGPHPPPPVSPLLVLSFTPAHKLPRASR